MDKPAFEEIGMLLRVVGEHMAVSGVMPAVLIGDDRDRASDEYLCEQMLELGIEQKRAMELLSLSLADIAAIEAV